VRKLSDLGERQAIRLIERVLAKGGSRSFLGDDCAALDIGSRYLLVTTDMIAKKTHMPSSMTPFQVGWMLAAVNLSDIAAKGGEPLGLVLSYGLPSSTTDAFLVEMTKGAMRCAKRNGTRIVGGDTKEAADITLCGTAFGLVRKNEFMPRKGIHPGDILAVTGTLGKAGAGYHALQYKEIKANPAKAFLEPTPRLREGRLLARSHAITSSMDLSDGLSSSLYQLRDLNKVGFTIETGRLPVSRELTLLLKHHPTLNAEEILLHSGGDYELLVTLPKTQYPRLARLLQRQGSRLTQIGRATKDRNIFTDDGVKTRRLPNKGYEHFSPHHRAIVPEPSL
jgi:thiamine-monophosphate kinase